jgi:hypothetical protein
MLINNNLSQFGIKLIKVLCFCSVEYFAYATNPILPASAHIKYDILLNSLLLNYLTNAMPCNLS